MSRDNILHRVRTALGRGAGRAPADPPPSRLRVPEVACEARIASMLARVEALAAQAIRTCRSGGGGSSLWRSQARPRWLPMRPFWPSAASPALPGVRSGITDREELRALCAAADVRHHQRRLRAGRYRVRW